MSTMTISSEQIVADRENRKNAGLTGCLTGRPVPNLDFFGYRDVQIWFVDAFGRLNGDPSFDFKNPMCFCFDCRGAFDPKGEVDAELVNAGHQKALYAYRSLFPNLNIVQLIDSVSSQPSVATHTSSSSSESNGFSNESLPSLVKQDIPLLTRS